MNLIPQSGNLMRRFFLLAPPGELPFRFREVAADPDLHADALARVQQFRGEVYVEEGNLTSEDSGIWRTACTGWRRQELASVHDERSE